VKNILITFLVLGALAGLITGFASYRASGGTADFLMWVSPSSYGNRTDDALLWTMCGLFLGATAAYIFGERLT
jgi:hypothetical protein